MASILNNVTYRTLYSGTVNNPERTVTCIIQAARWCPLMSLSVSVCVDNKELRRHQVSDSLCKQEDININGAGLGISVNLTVQLFYTTVTGFNSNT